MCYLVLAIMLPVVFLTWKWHFRAGEEAVQQWASEKGLKLISYERRNWNAGPYKWKRLSGHLVYFVTVVEPSGVTRKAWIRVWDPFFGFTKARIDITFE